MKHSNIDPISTEKKKVMEYFTWRFVIILTFVSVYCVLAYQFITASRYPLGNEQVLGLILFLLPGVLVFITVRLVVIPETVSVKEDPGLKRIVMLVYLSSLVLIVLLPLLPLDGIMSLLTRVKIALVLFIVCLNLLVLYARFLYSSIDDSLTRLFNLSAVPFIRDRRVIGRRLYEKTNRKIFSLGRLIIHALHENDEMAFSLGLAKLETLGRIMLASSKLDPILLNDFLKNIAINYRYIVAESLERKSENYLKQALAKIDALGKILVELSESDIKLLNDSFKNMIMISRDIDLECIKAGLENRLMLTFSNTAGLIKHGLRCQAESAAKINYPPLITETGKVGITALQQNMSAVGGEIINNLARIGELSLSRQLDHPPVLEVLTALQEIGSSCAEREWENLCLETLIRIQLLAVEALNGAEFITDSALRIENEKIYHSALASHWIVSAFLFKKIPESGEWLRDSRGRMEEIFGDSYFQAYDQALRKLDMTSYVGKKVLLDYYAAILERR
jgi:hypothetical protein